MDEGVEMIETESAEPAASFVVVSVYVRPDGRRVVHAWGPRETRTRAQSLAARIRREDKREYAEDPRLDALTLHVCEISDNR